MPVEQLAAHGSAAHASSWVEASTVTACHDCAAVFSLFKQKHHCSHCGNIFCRNCTSERMLLEPSSGVHDPVRVCIGCAAQLLPHQEEYAAANANCTRANHLQSDAVRQPLPAALRPHANNPFSRTLGSAIRNATFTLNQLDNPTLLHDQKVPLALMQKAEGFVFLTFLRVGVFGGVKFGSGVAVMKREDGTWSAPSAVGIGGAFIGVTFGADVVNLCLVLTSKEVCESFMRKGQVSFEGEAGASIGPIGRNVSAGISNGSAGLAPVYSYAQSKGLLVGVDINGSYIYTRNRVNQKFYGLPHTAEQILKDVPQPEAGYILHEGILRLTNTRQYQKLKKEHKAAASKDAHAAPNADSDTLQGENADH